MTALYPISSGDEKAGWPPTEIEFLPEGLEAAATRFPRPSQPKNCIEAELARLFKEIEQGRSWCSQVRVDFDLVAAD